MKKSTILLATFLIGTSAYSLFYIKYQVRELTRNVIELNRQIAGDKETIHVLKAEWAYLSQPSRLKMLSEQYLHLKYIAANQVKSDTQVYGISENTPGTEHYSMTVVPALKPILSSARNYD